jgi:hypothetical protein
MTIRSRSNEERSGSTRAQTAIVVIKQMRRTPRTTRIIKTRGQLSGGSYPQYLLA